MIAKTCENIFCIYWKENSCTLESISLDMQGNCTDCIYIELEKTVLENARKNLLEKLDLQYKRK